MITSNIGLPREKALPFYREAARLLRFAKAPDLFRIQVFGLYASTLSILNKCDEALEVLNIFIDLTKKYAGKIKQSANRDQWLEVADLLVGAQISKIGIGMRLQREDIKKEAIAELHVTLQTALTDSRATGGVAHPKLIELKMWQIVCNCLMGSTQDSEGPLRQLETKLLNLPNNKERREVHQKIQLALIDARANDWSNFFDRFSPSPN